MKFRYKIVFLVLALATAGILTNCSDDSEGGTPMISYVRVTDPASSDSLLIAAGQGQMIAIIGENLQNTQQVWFNDQRATLTTTFISPNSILLRVPSEIPQVLTTQVQLIFAHGESLVYDFSVDISKPEIDHIKSEYVRVGETGTVYGNYFYTPITITLTGGVQAEITSVEEEIIE